MKISELLNKLNEAKPTGRTAELRDMYLGSSVTLNGNSAKIKDAQQGEVAVIQSGRESAETSWWIVDKVMNKGGNFRSKPNGTVII